MVKGVRETTKGGKRGGNIFHPQSRCLFQKDNGETSQVPNLFNQPNHKVQLKTNNSYLEYSETKMFKSFKFLSSYMVITLTRRGAPDLARRPHFEADIQHGNRINRSTGCQPEGG